MNLREQARRAGGDELVAQLDRAQCWSRHLQAGIRHRRRWRPWFEGTEEQVSLAAACEALSSALANATAILTIKAFGGKVEGS